MDDYGGHDHNDKDVPRPQPFTMDCCTISIPGGIPGDTKGGLVFSLNCQSVNSLIETFYRPYIRGGTEPGCVPKMFSDFGSEGLI